MTVPVPSGCIPILPTDTLRRAAAYRDALLAQTAQPGALLRERLQGVDLSRLAPQDLLGLLCDTRKPQIFPESQVAGDGSDWTLTELGLMGDGSMAVPVTVFDNGDHTYPLPHATPFPAVLLFTAGALLCNDRGKIPADWPEVVGADGGISADGLLGLYRRRLLPLLRFVNQHAEATRSALITIPGLGCGQFAGPFRGAMGPQLERVLRQLLLESGAELPNIQAIHFDPYGECRPSQGTIAGIQFQVRPSRAAGLKPIPQLCPPEAYAGPATTSMAAPAAPMTASRPPPLMPWP